MTGMIDLSKLVTAEMKQEQAKAGLLSAFSDALQKLLDAKAAERRYDSIQTAVTYRNDPNKAFASESEALFKWRSAVWTYSGKELDKVMSGKREIPDLGAFLDEVSAACPFAWPAL